MLSGCYIFVLIKENSLKSYWCNYILKKKLKECVKMTVESIQLLTQSSKHLVVGCFEWVNQEKLKQKRCHFHITYNHQINLPNFICFTTRSSVWDTELQLCWAQWVLPCLQETRDITVYHGNPHFEVIYFVFSVIAWRAGWRWACCLLRMPLHCSSELLCSASQFSGASIYLSRCAK